MTTTPPATATVPEGEELRKLLAGLLGKPVTLKAPPCAPRPSTGPQVQALYVQDDGSPRAFCSVDLPLAANLGAAMALMPAAAAAEAARTGKPSEIIQDCMHEVLNVCARLMNKPGGMHVKLKEIALAPKALDAAVRAELSKGPLQKEYDIEVAGYGRGKIVFRAA